MLLIRALIAFLALPAVLGGLVPWLLLPNDRWRTRGTSFGWALLALGAGILLSCVRDFYVTGRGTLAPWDPPKRLVIVGLYRFMRNPMYVGVLGFVAACSLLTGSPLLAAYTFGLWIAFHLRVVLYEEPVLARQFPDDWAHYRSAVNRWLPKLWLPPA